MKCRMMMNRVVEMYSVYTGYYQYGLCQRQQSRIGGLDKARCDDIGGLSGDVVISSRQDDHMLLSTARGLYFRTVVA